MTTQPESPRESTIKRIEDELKDAYEFDPRDPLFGLTAQEMSGPNMSRRAALRLMAAAAIIGDSNNPKIG